MDLCQDHLAHFVKAQEPIYDQALAEIRAGKKRSHWMWFVFPQLQGLGRSEMAERFGLTDLAHARSYLRHPVLGSRLRECVAAALGLPETRPERIFGDVDAVKLRSSLTLFSAADPGDPVFARALMHFFSGKPDCRTLSLLG